MVREQKEPPNIHVQILPVVNQLVDLLDAIDDLPPSAQKRICSVLTHAAGNATLGWYQGDPPAGREWKPKEADILNAIHVSISGKPIPFEKMKDS